MHKTKKIIVNSITSLRLIATLVIAPIFLTYGGIVTAEVIAAFFLTDFIDGKLARKWHVESFLGSLLDSLSDKTLAISSLLTLTTINPLFSIPLLLEVGIAGVNKALYQNGHNIHANIVGKAKAWVLGAGITLGFLTNDLAAISKTVSESAIKNLTTASTLLPTIACGATLVSYCYSFYQAQKQEQELAKLESHLAEIKDKKIELQKTKKTLAEICHDLVDTEFYNEHKSEPIMQLLYKND